MSMLERHFCVTEINATSVNLFNIRVDMYIPNLNKKTTLTLLSSMSLVVSHKKITGKIRCETLSTYKMVRFYYSKIIIMLQKCMLEYYILYMNQFFS